jgi:hypothetical protein
VTDIRNLLLDAWNDLRARRLLPVAAVLLVGLVAAPIVLSKKASDSAPAPQTSAPSTAQAPKGPDALAQVKLGDELQQGSGSSLSSFGVSNPFAPPSKVLKAGEPATSTTSVADTASQATTDTGTGTTGDTGTGTTGDTGGTGGTGGGTGGGGQKTTEFTYVLDVTFWAKGHRREIKGMEKLDVLPSPASPLLIYMGVTGGGGNSVFLVDATLQTTGEGKCKPSRANCAFLYLGAGAEQEFTTEDGDSYRLRIDQIRKVKVGDQASASGATASSKKTKSARAAADDSTATRRFVLPALTDLIEVTTGNDSTGDEERR